MGETQERERVLAHFSQRYFQCNPGALSSEGKEARHRLSWLVTEAERHWECAQEHECVCRSEAVHGLVLIWLHRCGTVHMGRHVFRVQHVL